MEKNIRDYIHHYLGCECKTSGGKYGRLVSVGESGSIIVYHNDDPRGFFIMSAALKPILRKLSDMTEEEAKTVLQKLLGTADIIFSKVNDTWAACENDPNEDEEDWLSGDPVERIYFAEEADYDNVLSISRANKSLAHGTDEEMRFFVEMKVQSQYINELRKMGFDCDGLIKHGLAIDRSTLKENIK